MPRERSVGSQLPLIKMDNSRFFPAGDSCENSIRAPRDHLPSLCSSDRIRDRCRSKLTVSPGTGVKKKRKKEKRKKGEKNRREGEMNCLARRRVYSRRVVARERAFPAADPLGAEQRPS
jgi:hypothetical protein